MITYRDMTFCDGNGGQCKSFKTCFRALTPEVQERADRIGLPVCQFTDPTAEECYVAPGAKKTKQGKQ